MTYRPKETSKAARLTAFIAVALAAGLFYASAVVKNYPFAYQFAAIVLMIAGVEVLVKYVLSDHVYEAADKDLKIYRVMGKKSVCIASLAYEESLCEVVASNDYQAKKDRFPKTQIVVNACKNVFPQSYSLYFFNFNGRNAVLKFEPDALFAAYLDDKIRAALAAKEDEDNA